ncbi:hypothetical protein AB6A40_006927 [Gnathostoma spinigerum]|uniref:Uncharacterized protein n=1 Tax=Gnathostoma spinigerum TaxID=75299 RepID=A0ABD6ET49_9BILA
MMSNVFLMLIVSLSLFISFSEALTNKEICNRDGPLFHPCRCCKVNCWYSIASAATHELGHIPGQEGENEALATLRLIRMCMIAECSDICSVRSVLMPRMPMSSLNIANVANPQN